MGLTNTYYQVVFRDNDGKLHILKDYISTYQEASEFVHQFISANPCSGNTGVQIYEINPSLR